jgi:hypothetical protein
MLQFYAGQVTIRDIGSGPMGWTLMLCPDPPHEPRWLDLTTAPGGPALASSWTVRARDPVRRRCRYDGQEGAAQPGRVPAADHRGAAARDGLASPAGDAAADRPQPEAPTRLTDGLGDVIAALQACGALSPLSPLPGQLATLCAGLNVGGHGITAPPARDRAEPWLSLLAHHRRRKTRTPPASHGFAAAAAALLNWTGPGSRSSALTPARTAPSCTCMPAARTPTRSTGRMSCMPGR